MQVITIDAKDFLAGESNWDYISDKGFSSDSYGLNLLLKPGVLNLGWTNTDRGGATLLGNIVASAYDKNGLTNDGFFVDDLGNFYTLSGATFTKRQTSTNTTGFQLGTTDLIEFKDNVYATYNGTTNGYIAQVTGASMSGGITSDWWVITGGISVRHPMEVVEDSLYIGSANIIYFYDGTTSGVAVTLPSDVNVTSLRKHPDGRHIIAFTGEQYDFSHTQGGGGRIYIVNKDTLTWEREIKVDTQIEGSRNVGGVIYCTWGKKLGYFTGSGIKFLKKLKTSATTYSQSMGNLEDILAVRDGTNILLYGDLGNGVNSWHNVYNGATVNSMLFKGGSVLCVGTASATLIELDYSTASASSGLFMTNRYHFDSMVKVRRMDIIHDPKTSGSTQSFTVYYRDQNDILSIVKSVSYAVGSTPSRTRIEIDQTSDVFQFRIIPGTGALVIKLMRIYYEPVIQ